MDSTVYKPAAEDVEKWNQHELLKWIQQKRPGLLEYDQLEKFKAAHISGEVFLNHAGNPDIFEKKCNLAFGVSETLANLAAEIAGMETAGIKRNKKRPGDAEMSDPASKKSRQESETDDKLQELATSAHQQRERIRLEIEKLNWLPALPPKNVVSPPKDAVSPPNDVVSPPKGALRLLKDALRSPKRALRSPERTLRSSKRAVPPSKRAVPSSKDTVPPFKDTVPPSKDTVPPSKDTVPPSKDTVSYPNYVLHLSNPTFDTKLPFPFVGQIVPGRFQVNGKDNERDWFYMGREKFAKLITDFERIRSDPQRSALTIYGTRGYGKSHLLTALVCYLAAREEKVVYIPDCREFMKQPVPYIIAAILFAWADHKSEQQRIMALDTQEKINQFFQGQKDVVFVIDQTNALEKENGDDQPTISKKGRLRDWLQGIQATGKAVLSSSANNHSIISEALKQSSNEVMPVYGGLTKNEMEHWWTRRQVELGDYTKNEVEDFTGCIPWFLEKCVVDGAIDLTTKFFTEIYAQAWEFEQEIQTKYNEDLRRLQRHYEYMRACLFGLSVLPSSIVPGLVDHRYFYDEYDTERKSYVAHYTCGICRNAVASMILENKVRFDRKLLRSLPKYTSNPCVTGFIIEQAILAWISLQGLNISTELNRQMGVTLFQDDVPSFDTTTNDPVLYIPKVFNFRNIDGIIIQIAPKTKSKRGGQRKLYMFPIQITLAPKKHLKSRPKFFSEWETWTESLRGFDVVPEFVWITPKAATTTKHPESNQWPAHVERYVPIERVSTDIWTWYEEGKRSKRIAYE